MSRKSLAVVDLRVWGLGFLVAAAACAHYPLMYAFRKAAAARFPAYVQYWPNDGRFSVLGYYGVEEVDQLNYASKVNEASRRLIPRDPFMVRPLDYAAFDWISYFVLGRLHAVVGDINLTWLIARFLCCLAWFLLIYRLALRLTGREEAAVFCGAAGVFLGYAIAMMFLRAPPPEGGFLQVLAGWFWRVASYGRTEGVWRLPRPGLSMAALFAATLIWLRAVDKPALGRWLAAGLAGGLLGYVRIDAWSGLMGAYCLFPIAAFAFTRRFNPWWLLPPALALAVSWPVLTHMLAPGEEFYVKIAMAGVTRKVDLESLIYPPILAWVLWRRRDLPVLCLACVAAAVFLLCNASLVTGKAYYAFLWRIFGNFYLFLLVVAALPRRWLDRPALWRGLSAAALAVCLLQNIYYAGLRYTWEALPKDIGTALDWLGENADPDSVVLSLGPEVNALVPAFTESKVVLGNGWPNLSEVTLEETIARARWGAAVLGADERKFLAGLIDPPPVPEQRTLLKRGPEEMGFLTSNLLVRPDAAHMAPIIAKELAGPARSFAADYLWVDAFTKHWMARAPERLPGLRLQLVLDLPTLKLYRIKNPAASGK